MHRYFDQFGNLIYGSLFLAPSGDDAGGNTDEDEGDDEDDPSKDITSDTAPESSKTPDNAEKDRSAPAKKTFSQREFNNALERERVRLETSLTTSLTEKIRSEILADAELTEAKSKGELGKVVEKLQQRVDILSPLEVENAEFRKLSNQRYQQAFEGLPDSIKLFAPADDASPLEKERWLVEKALPAAEQLGDGDPVKGLSKKDDPSKKKPSQEEKLQAISNGLATSGDYRPM